MDEVFPFGFPFATGFYLVLMVVVLAIHVVFMNYALAGTGFLAVTTLQQAHGQHSVRYRVLKDWMPVMVSGAITAGVAPLLFVQILYKREFYTANLLLFNRFMLILPALIIGFYAFYLAKSGWLQRRPRWLIVLVTAVPFACFGFTGYTWTENHLLSVRSQAEWGQFYTERPGGYYEAQLFPRLAVWLIGAIPTLCGFLAWQLWYLGKSGDAAAREELPKLAKLALAGIGSVGLAAIVYAAVAGPTVRGAFIGPMAWPYFLLAFVGVGLQISGWVMGLRKGFDSRKLLLVAAGLFCTIAGMTVCRECLRITELGPERMAALFPRHDRAKEVRGFATFLTFFVLNSGLVAFAFYLVRTQKKNV